jgi:hypothetical protein
MWCLGCTTPTGWWSSKTVWAVAAGGYCSGMHTVAPSCPCGDESGGAARQASAPQATTDRGRTDGLPTALEQAEQCASARGKGKLVTKAVWLVQVMALGTLLRSVENEEQAVRIFARYRQRWAVEDSFKVTKVCLGWEEVKMLDLRGIRTLVALAWVAAGFLYRMGVTFEWAEVQLLAKLGGWVPHKDRRPGKITLMRGLHRLLDLLATQAILSDAAAQPEGLPPKIMALLQGWQSPQPDL